MKRKTSLSERGSRICHGNQWMPNFLSIDVSSIDVSGKTSSLVRGREGLCARGGLNCSEKVKNVY